jgi:tetratricopeptide (TPR) repeat protein
MADAPETSAKIDSLRAKVEADPKSRHFYPLAEELRKIGRIEEAETVLRSGLEHHSTYLSAWVSLGRILRDRGSLEEAVQVLMRGLALDPENVVTAKLLAHVHLARGNKVEAIKKFKLVTALMPSDDEAAEQIAILDRELNEQESPVVPPEPAVPTAEPEPDSAPFDEAGSFSEATPHDSTEPPFEMAEPEPAGGAGVPAFSPDELLAAATSQPPEAEATPRRSFDLTNPDPFALEQKPAEAEGEPLLELADEVVPFAGSDLPESGVQTEPAPTTTAEEPGPVPPAASRRAPSAEDVWSQDEEPSGVLPESAATVTMAQILAQQGDLERAKETYERVLERDPGNTEAREGLAFLSREQGPDERVRRLEAWRRKVVGS